MKTTQTTLESDAMLAAAPASKRMILKEALHLFARNGIESVTVRDIAARAGYTNPALFKFFPSKDALAIYLFEICYTAIYENLAAELRPDMPFEAQLRGIVTAALFEMHRDLDAFLFVQDELRRMWPRVSKDVRKRSILGLIRRVLEKGLKEGKVRVTTDPNLLLAAITGTLQQFARMVSFGEIRKPVTDHAGELERILLSIVQRDPDQDN